MSRWIINELLQVLTKCVQVSAAVSIYQKLPLNVWPEQMVLNAATPAAVSNSSKSTDLKTGDKIWHKHSSSAERVNLYKTVQLAGFWRSEAVL